MPSKNEISKGQKIAGGILKLAMITPLFSVIGIALFDRSHSINDGIVIAAGVFFALIALIQVGSTLRQVCAEPVTGRGQSTID